jgi:photosystem II stability/assembly factor-like uncharacterized protein
MPHRIISLFTIIFFALLASSSYAQLPPMEWQSLQVDEGSFVKQDKSTNTLFINAYFSLYYSTDGGSSWNASKICRFNTERRTFVINSLARYDDSTLFAGGENRSTPDHESLYRSTDNGRTWKPILFGDKVNTVLVYNSTILVNTVNWRDGSFIFRSADKGTTWQKFKRIPANIEDCTLLKTGDSSMIAVDWLFDETFLRSDDYGNSWQPITKPYPKNLRRMAQIGNTLLCSVPADADDKIPKIYRSYDAGRTWSVILDSTDQHFFYFLATDGKKFYALGYKNEDAGEFYSANTVAFIYSSDSTGRSWKKMGIVTSDFFWKEATPPYISTFTTFMVNKGAIFLPRGGNVYRTLDTAKTWQIVHTRYINENIRHMVSTQGVLYAATESGLYRSSNNSQTWRLMGTLSVEYARLNGAFPREFLEDQNIQQGSNIVQIEALSPAHIFATFHVGFFKTRFIYPALLMESLDSGKTWKKLFTPNKQPDINTVHSLQSFALHKNRIFLAQSDAPYVSDTSKQQWQKLSLPNNICQFISHQDMIVGFSNNGKIYRSLDNGITWDKQILSNDSIEIRKIVVIGKTFFTATNNGMYRSENDGVSWKSINVGLPTTNIVSVIATEKIVLASVGGNGLYISTNKGETWKLENKDIQFSQILFHNSSAVGFSNELIYSAKLPALTPEILNTIGSTSIRIFPHPISQTTTIGYRLREESRLNISVFNMYGVKVAEVADVELSAGEYFFDWTPQNIPSGMYLVRCTTSSSVETKTVQYIR